jgi:hypothetical protein
MSKLKTGELTNNKSTNHALSLTNDRDQIWDSGLQEFQTIHTLNPSEVPSLWTVGSATTYPLPINDPDYFRHEMRAEI